MAPMCRMAAFLVCVHRIEFGQNRLRVHRPIVRITTANALKRRSSPYQYIQPGWVLGESKIGPSSTYKRPSHSAARAEDVLTPEVRESWLTEAAKNFDWDRLLEKRYCSVKESWLRKIEENFDSDRRDIQLATGNVPCTGVVPNRDRAYHGNTTEHAEQSEVEVCRIVRRLNAKDRVGLFTRLGVEKEFLYSKAELGGCKDQIGPLLEDGPAR
ncbi:hypothetical protein F5888DRAFT_1634265 [Russula emetica]|nr:hypothetical protein F5888DRAFT_1634265 [Russula emetica]